IFSEILMAAMDDPTSPTGVRGTSELRKKRQKAAPEIAGSTKPKISRDDARDAVRSVDAGVTTTALAGNAQPTAKQSEGGAATLIEPLTGKLEDAVRSKEQPVTKVESARDDEAAKQQQREAASERAALE